MRFYVSGLTLLLLTGCQTTQTHHQTTDLPETTTDIKIPSHTSSEVTQPSQLSQKKAPIKTLSPQQQTDLWKRLSMQFSLATPKQKSIEYYRKWYLRHPKHLRTVAERAKPFLYLITEKIEQRGLPLELALLPIVESAYDAFAYSYGRAAGLWQFVPATGKRYGLKQNYWYDGRRDVVASTDAALDYLSYLHKRFNGNWFHAIAAYNSGGGRVAQAIRNNQRKGKPTDFFSLNLPKETSSYVPKLLALAEVIAHQKKYGISIPKIPNKPVLEIVNPKEQLDLAIAARYAQISIKQLQSYNPAFNQWATAPNGPYNLLLPVSKVEHFRLALEKNRGRGIKYVRYRVKSGDSLSTIAKRYHTTAEVIQTANRINSHLIRTGHFLLIPTSVKNDRTYVLSANNRLAEIQSRRQGKYKFTHTIHPGDSFWRLAKRYHVSQLSIAKWNGMSPKDPLIIGKKLVIWKNFDRGSIIRTLVYHVRHGDNLSVIANKFKIKTTDIIKWNSLNREQYLQPGQQLTLYVDVTKVSS
jgi:membrane-bound lytic murein transglycosylase D